jgi:tight adherence protein B
MNDLSSQFNLTTLIFAIVMLATALALLFMLAGTLTGESKRLRRRLAQITVGEAGRHAAASQQSLRRETADSSIASFDKLIKRWVPQPAKLRARLAATGHRISLGEYVLACFLVAIISFSARLAYGELPLLVSTLIALGSGIGIPHSVVSFMIKRRSSRFTMLLPEAIDLIVRGLRSGLPITESIKVVGQEIPDPVGIEFRRIIESFALGMTLDDALWAAAERLNVSEFRFFAISLSVQQETGGNLTETLDNLAEILRRRKQLKLKIRALTGEARASAAILGSLPFIMFGTLLLIRPEYVDVMLTTHQGHVMLGMGFGSIALGIGIMIKMTKFEI